MTGWEGARLHRERFPHVAPAARQADVHGIVLAGVHAWGENVLERVICRPLVRVAARPLICHTLEWLRQGGVTAASICANSDTIHLRRQLGDGSHLAVELDYYEDVMPRGPAGCARDVAAGTDSDTFLVVEGTILPKIDLDDLLRSHEASGAVLTVVASARPAEAGSPHALEPVGMYVFSRAAFDSVPASGYQDIKESLIPRLYANGSRVRSYMVDGVSAPAVKGVASYLAVSEWVVEQLVRQEPPPGYHARGQGLVHCTVRIEPSARLVGPVWIEAGSVIGPESLVIGPAIIGAGSSIGRGAVVSRSAIWERSTIAAGAVLDQCIVTDEAVVESGRAVRHQVIVPEPAGARSLLGRLLSPRRRHAKALLHELSTLRRQEEALSRRPDAGMRTGAVARKGTLVLDEEGSDRVGVTRNA